MPVRPGLSGREGGASGNELKETGMTRESKGWRLAAMAAVGLIVVSAGVAWAQAPARGGGETAATAPAITNGPAEPAPAVPAVPPATAPAPTDTAAPGDRVGGEGQAPKGGLSTYLMPVMLVALLLVFVLMGRKPRKEEKRRQAMLADLKKGDKVTTIGGIIGTITEVRENEVIVKIDETSNTRVKFVRSAIRAVGTPDESEKKEEK